MCTVTIVPHGRGFQLGCNRDELLSRPGALPPQVHLAGDLLAVFPTDPLGGGTWIGVNERGLAIAMLNRTVTGDRAAVASRRCSRGVAGRHLLGAEDLDHAVRRVTALPLRAFDPFTIVALHRRSVAVVTNDGFEYAVSARMLERPVCFTSSSLGDDLVAPRLELFERSVAAAREPLLMQAPYHAHRWPDRPHLSVDMRRRDAATSSRTWIDVSGERASLTYDPLHGDPATVPLALREVPCSSSLASSSRPS